MNDYQRLLQRVVDQVQTAANLKEDYKKLKAFVSWCEKEIETSKNTPSFNVERSTDDTPDLWGGSHEFSIDNLTGEYQLIDDPVESMQEKAIDPTKVIEPEMIRISAGKFTMGSNDETDATPAHEVTIEHDFMLAKTPVTYREYKRYFDAWLEDARKQHRVLTQKEHLHYDWGGEVPVVEVSWNDVQSYIDWLNSYTGKTYRLPTEAEWEYASRAGSYFDFSFGDEVDELKLFAWYLDNSEGRAQPVGKKLPNDWGVYDMHGNVWEWVQDCYANDYSKTPIDGSAHEPEGCDRRVVRGGSWDHWSDGLKSAHREKWPQGATFNDVGFRLAHDI